MQPMHPPPRPSKPRRRKGGFGRFIRGYFMLVGICTTIIGLIFLLVRLFVEIDKWLPSTPIL